MPATVSIEVPVAQVDLVRRLLAFHEELDQPALAAPDGTVFDACESAVVAGGRDLQVRMLQQAVARRIEAAEKKGPRSASARAAGPKRTAVPKPASS